jgi:hypothetical protein
MKKLSLFVILAILSITITRAQAPSNRMKARYYITSKKLSQLNNDNFFITDGITPSLELCGKTKLKVLITATAGLLKIDPWKIVHDPANGITDGCLGKADKINSTTVNNLSISINRKLVGDPTIAIKIPYNAWIIGLNAIALKIRPKVEDYKGNLYSANAVGASINLGPSIGYSFGYTTFTHRTATSWSATPSISLGFSTVSLAKEPLKKEVVTTFTPSNFVLSPSFSLIIARNDLGITFCYGKDAMMGRHKTAWAYQGKSFFGIGIAAGLKL